MAGRANQIDQLAAMSKVIEVAPHAAALRDHVRCIVESPAFKGSRRSQEFLQFVVERALHRHFGELKERALGVELFGRSPSYDTGDDAIVRVTACDVRKRLSQFYAEFGPHSDFRVDIPPGSYIPEFRNRIAALPVDMAGAVETPAGIPPDVPVVAKPDPTTTAPGLRIGVALAGVAAIVLFCAALWFWKQQRSLEATGSPRHVLPWSAVIQPDRPAHVVFCDPEIVTVQRLLNYSVTLSDYANQHYWPVDMKPDARHVLQQVSFRGATVAAVDAGIALRIDNLSVPFTRRAMEMHTARGLRLADFKTEDNFILFGSPRSNPWVELFQDQLDFSFKFDNDRKAEYISNKHPRTGETPSYIPTAGGWDTGHAYAIVALVGNPDQKGQVLLLAGSNAEATEAAGKFATDLEALSTAFKSHGIDPNGSVRHFEILLRVSTMAGSSNTFDVVACHPLK